MIVEGYEMHLYCSCCDARAEFSEYSRKHAYSDARRAGWVFRSRDTLCPVCVRAGETVPRPASTEEHER